MWGDHKRPKNSCVKLTKDNTLNAEKRFSSNPAIILNVVLLGVNQKLKFASFCSDQCTGTSRSTASALVNESFDKLVKTDKGYIIKKNQRFSFSYYRDLHQKMMTKVRQNGKTTWFCSVSLHEHPWPYLLPVFVSQLSCTLTTLTDEELLNNSYEEENGFIQKSCGYSAIIWQIVSIFSQRSCQRISWALIVHPQLLFNCRVSMAWLSSFTWAWRSLKFSQIWQKTPILIQLNLSKGLLILLLIYQITL